MSYEYDEKIYQKVVSKKILNRIVPLDVELKSFAYDVMDFFDNDPVQAQEYFEDVLFYSRNMFKLNCDNVLFFKDIRPSIEPAYKDKPSLKKEVYLNNEEENDNED